ncbi:PREDICTED: flap endonuclease GEN homolog 1-like isoform X2 [Priapulus caudatus]|uniref:Flap endonuclease GEN homolog 1-like isoform X2 n=1 Tax=Priapulus caudatus TaxID=37621 RepID=A0ABM1EB62_PRICU|nr:PREDICTED: flap endonuclease GEN homolog 1-like isoform X2 [Priapulus caudatus]
MGVKGLWDILDPVQKYTTLQDLEGQTLAVDMSAWVVENQLQGVQRHLLNAHVRNLFFRVSYMIRHNIKLVFVTEGTAPAVKASTIAKRREKLPCHSESKQPSNGHPNMKRNYLKGLSKPCCTLLEHMGIPCVTSTGEAEATCALLNQLGLADAVITEDGDAFLYGARTVYRNFSISKDAHVDAYTTDDIERSLGLSRRHLVALALLIGCDYHDGVPHIGKEKALLLFKTLGEDDPLDRFKRWTNDRWFNDLPTAESIGKLKHCVRCKHPGQKRQHQKTGCIHCSSAISCVPSDDGYECKCEWHQQKVIADKHAVELRVRKEALTVPGFPSDEIIKEFLNFNEDMPKEPFVWRRPKLDMIVGMLGAQLHWDPVDVVKKVIPLITAWDLQDIATRGRTNPQHMKPIRIVQSRVAQGIDSLEVEWEKLDGDRWTTSSYYSTVESEKSFSTAYPDMAKAFFDELLAKRAKKKSKRKNENDHTQTKLSDYFKVKKFAS